MTNIIVKDGKIKAIIDLVYSDCFPSWVERWKSLMGANDEALNMAAEQLKSLE